MKVVWLLAYNLTHRLFLSESGCQYNETCDVLFLEALSHTYLMDPLGCREQASASRSTDENMNGLAK